MLMTVTPLTISAVGGYSMVDRHVIGAFKDVAMRQRDEIGPTQHLRLLLWEIGIPVDDYLDTGRVEKVMEYQTLHTQIEERFPMLQNKMQSEIELKILIDNAYADWKSADTLATEILSVQRPAGDANGSALMDQFDKKIVEANGKLKAVHNALLADVNEDHDDALETYKRTEWLAATAAVVSVLAMIAGVALIGKFMLASVDRLIDGASRFAAGDREHRIEIQVPPELRRVAQEFNHMITKIHTAETALANAAMHDALTGLLNRRAFDEALAETFARLRRLDEKTALVMMDLDHFKRINDSFGHGGGDVVLRMVAQAMLATVRDIDKVFRIGGEEFALLLQGVDLPTAHLAAERLRVAIAGQTIPIDGKSVTVTVSGGVALVHRMDTVDTLTKTADEALYRAKELGRNRIISDIPKHEIA
jgi:diguanylate cyclase (GGDEF)-like protein